MSALRILASLKCWAVGHNYVVHQVFSPATRRVKCPCCDGDWAMNDRERIIVPWNGEFEEFYKDQSL